MVVAVLLLLLLELLLLLLLLLLRLLSLMKPQFHHCKSGGTIKSRSSGRSSSMLYVSFIFFLHLIQFSFAIN